MQQSPLQMGDIDPVPQAACKEFASKWGLKRLLVAYPTGTSFTWQTNMCPHEMLALAARIVEECAKVVQHPGEQHK